MKEREEREKYKWCEEEEEVEDAAFKPFLNLCSTSHFFDLLFA